MSVYLGVDTSNYTTSLCLLRDGKVEKNLKKSVYVGENQRGVRQSDALFFHTKNLPELYEELGRIEDLTAIGYSSRPRDVEGSYMPCFLAGETLARSCAALLGVPALAFSHQAGHIRAALYSAHAEHIAKTPFIAFHLSGGTTEVLLIKNGSIEKIGGTLDLTAGQAIDRIGVSLGLRFPCGAEMEKLAAGMPTPKVRVCVRGTECHLSGLENLAAKMKEEGASREEIAAFTIEYVRKTVQKLSENALAAYGKMPVLYAGGVMSCAILQKDLGRRFEAYFARPEFSSDNAAGAALLCMDALEGKEGKT